MLTHHHTLWQLVDSLTLFLKGKSEVNQQMFLTAVSVTGQEKL